MNRPPASLQARALAWLAQREQSRSELRRKLLRLASRQQEQEQEQEQAKALAEAAAKAARGQTYGATAEISQPTELRDQVERLLDTLESKGLLSDERFIDSRVRVRAAGMGARRIEMELAQHGLKLGAQARQQLRDTEIERAAQLWRRKFGVTAVDARERARQMRFLAARGFSAEVIRCVLAGAGDAPSEDSS